MTCQGPVTNLKPISFALFPLPFFNPPPRSGACHPFLNKLGSEQRELPLFSFNSFLFYFCFLDPPPFFVAPIQFRNDGSVASPGDSAEERKRRGAILNLYLDRDSFQFLFFFFHLQMREIVMRGPEDQQRIEYEKRSERVAGRTWKTFTISAFCSTRLFASFRILLFFSPKDKKRARHMCSAGSGKLMLVVGFHVFVQRRKKSHRQRFGESFGFEPYTFCIPFSVFAKVRYSSKKGGEDTFASPSSFRGAGGEA